jgi:putative membrane protein insertion efficiency factor
MTRLLIVLVRAYQLSFAYFLGGRCRFTPSCSSYAIEALRRHGPWRGSALAAGRVLRCSPFCRGGHDPVPAGRLLRVCDGPGFAGAVFSPASLSRPAHAGLNRTPTDGP